MAASPTIVVQRLRVVRGGNVVLPDLSLSVVPGVVTGLLGPSGSGKTTLMRALVGVQRIAGGSVVLLGRAAGSPELRSRVAYMTQAPSVYGDLSVAENLRFFARLLDVEEDRVDAVLATVGLVDERARVVSRLSGGERARASLATALLGDPEVLVLDEPTVGLDPVLRRDLWESFAALAREGRTLLVSSHVMDEADRCDELVLLREGRVLAVDAPRELLARTKARDLDEAFLRLIKAGSP